MNNELVQRQHDFDVSYRFLRAEEGGRSGSLPLQGYRCDWVYADDSASDNGVYMIWPVFLDEAGGLLPKWRQIQASGVAQMHIVNASLRNTCHRLRLNPGVKGFFVEGTKRVAEATVLRVVSFGKQNI